MHNTLVRETWKSNTLQNPQLLFARVLDGLQDFPAVLAARQIRTQDGQEGRFPIGEMRIALCQCAKVRSGRQNHRIALVLCGG